MSAPVLMDPAELHRSLSDPALLSMNFLNEVAGRYPEAVSFAPGRPTEGGFDLDDLPRYLAAYTRHLVEEKGYDVARATRELFQYGRTKGVIHELVARQLELDEGIAADPQAVLVTVGAQEALYLLLRALRADGRDVLLAVSPTYVGLTGAARLVDLPVRPVAEGTDGVDLADLRAQLRAARAAGQRPRALYVVPDFANPSGHSMPVATRQALLDLAAEERILLIEDNPYSMFRADGSERPPTLKALDRGRHVVYLGSLAKTCFPGARVGFVVADQPVAGGGVLADELAKAKSMVTVNTSPVSQALVGGLLLTHGGSLLRANERQVAVYRENLARLLAGLRERFAAVAGVSWNEPQGGFFVVLTLPFPVTDELLERAAVEYGVLFTPMRHFGDGDREQRQLRLSCSSLTPQQIDDGLDRLARLVADHT